MEKTYKYKCPICGCTEYYSIRSISSGEKEVIESQTDKSKKTTTTKSIRQRSLVTSYLEISGDAWMKYKLDFNASVRLCKNCGHIDLFNSSMLESIESNKAYYSNKLKEKEDELAKLEKRKPEIDIELSAIKSREKDIEKLLKDENITIKMQKGLIAETKSNKEKISLLEMEKNQIEPAISKIENEICGVKYRLKTVDSEELVIETKDC